MSIDGPGEDWVMWSVYPPVPGKPSRWWVRWRLRITDRFRRDRDWPALSVAPDGRGTLIREAMAADLDDYYSGLDFQTWWDPKPPRPEPSDGWVWCSFTDPSLPEGERFLGAVVTTAAKWAMGLSLFDLNPGGEMVMVPIPAEHLDKVPPEFRDRILNREEAESL